MVEKVISPPSDSYQFHQMVELAEEVSLKTSDLRRSVFRLKIRIVTATLACYILMVGGFFVGEKIYYGFPTVVQSVGISIFLLISVLFFYSIFLMIHNLRSAQRELKVEKAILMELLSMLFEMRNLSIPGVDPIEEALLRIRLQRIKFSIESD